jgi:hypothetical protein
VGSVEIFVNVMFIDDFVFDREGNAWVALNPLWEFGVTGVHQYNATVVLGGLY